MFRCVAEPDEWLPLFHRFTLLDKHFTDHTTGGESDLSETNWFEASFRHNACIGDHGFNRRCFGLLCDGWGAGCKQQACEKN